MCRRLRLARSIGFPGLEGQALEARLYLASLGRNRQGVAKTMATITLVKRKQSTGLSIGLA